MNSTHSHSGHWPFLVFGVVAIAVGSLAIAKPQLSWRGNRWQYKNGANLEPSAAGLMFTRAIGGFFIVVAVIMIVIGIKQF